jgi:predicted RNase H-like HicB family nuclease
MRFSSYEEALAIAKAAADVLVERERQKGLILRDIHACAQAPASRPAA